LKGWQAGFDDRRISALAVTLERKIDDDIFNLYGITDEDRETIEADLARDSVADFDEVMQIESDPGEKQSDLTVSDSEFAIRWISYAVGIIVGRFEPGENDALGRAVYIPKDFAVGSLSEPDAAEFDELVAPTDRFAYVDTDGARHIFSYKVEQAL